MIYPSQINGNLFKPGMGNPAPNYSLDHSITRSLCKNSRSIKSLEMVQKFEPNEVEPGVMSTDISYQHFLSELSEELTSALPPSVNEHGEVYGNGVSSTFYDIRHISGIPMSPVNYPLASNLLLRKSLDLVDEYQEDWHYQVLYHFWIMLLSNMNLNRSNIRIKPKTSMGFPFMESSKSQKLDFVRMILLPQLDEIKKASNNCDYRTLINNHGLGGASVLAFRLQSSDTVSKKDDGSFEAKKRSINTLKDALCSDSNTSKHYASKKVDIPGKRILDGFFAQRMRSVYSVPFGINIFLMALSQPLMDTLMEMFSNTFHHTTNSSIQSKINKYDRIVLADSTQFDGIFSKQLSVDVMLKAMADFGIPKHALNIIEWSFCLPTMRRNQFDGTSGILIGDPYNPSTYSGLNSGNGFTSLIAKVDQSVKYMINQIENTAPELVSSFASKPAQTLSLYMNHMLDVAQLNCGDDVVLMWKKGVFSSRVDDYVSMLDSSSAQKDLSPAYTKTAVEKGGSFLGKVFNKTNSSKDSAISVIPRVQSYVRNEFCPEHGIQSNIRDRSKARRPYPGIVDRWVAYGEAPSFMEVKRIIERTWMKHFDYSFFSMKEEQFKKDEKALAQFLKHSSISLDSAFKDADSFSDIDREVLADPSKVAWKYTKEDVSPVVLQMISSELSENESNSIYKFMTE